MGLDGLKRRSARGSEEKIFYLCWESNLGRMAHCLSLNCAKYPASFLTGTKLQLLYQIGPTFFFPWAKNSFLVGHKAKEPPQCIMIEN
jgi:hypothetical protein